MLAPVAYLLQSSLLGFLAVVALFGALGFSVMCFGLGYVIVFDSEDTLHRARLHQYEMDL